ncbi:unnamed protein product [marine sediment metagenome]|uniref:Uncharacterized protein n=1 Tax=marine sediment metagenome TaxID=412755 RepID=X1U2Y8_9ZZZZ
MSRKALPGQIPLPFVAELDKQLAAEREVAEEKRHKEWAASTLRGMVERYPPTSYEWNIMLSGIRLARFVSHLECERCRYATQDHTVGWMFLSNICLKDYHKLTKKEEEVA